MSRSAEIVRDVLEADYFVDDPRPDAGKHPILWKLFTTGVVRLIDRELVGVASDGQEVNLGSDANSAERYLKSHPNPTDW
jgi:hypothetical protein